MFYIILSMVFIATVALVSVAYSILVFKKPIARLNSYFRWEEKQKEKTEKQKKKSLKENIEALSESISRLIKAGRYKEKIDKSLEKGDIPLKAEELIILVILLCILFLCIGLFLLNNLLVGIIMAVLTVVIIRLIIIGKGKKRVMEINQQLGDALDMMSGSLRAGYSFFQAMETVSKEMPLPISKEFTKVIKEIGFGLTVEAALESLVDRVPSDDLELVVTAVIIQRQIGGNLAEILDNISGTIRDRIKLKREVKTLTAQGRMSGWVIALLPVGFILILLVMNPEYLKVLFTDPLGRLMLVIGLIGQVIGILVIKRLINIEY